MLRHNESFGQTTIRVHAHLEITIASRMLMTINDPKPIEPQRYQKVLKVKFIGKTVSLIVHPFQQLDQLALIINFFPTAYEQLIRLRGSTTRAESTATAPVIPAFIPSSNSHVKTFDKRALYLQRITISPPSAKAVNVVQSQVLLKTFEYREWRWCQDRRILMTKVI